MIRDKRPVDELSVEELERILILKKREARMERFRGSNERRVDVPIPASTTAAPPAIASPVETAPEAAVVAVDTPPPAVYDDGTPRFEDEFEPAYAAPRPDATYDEYRPRLGFLSSAFSKFLLLAEVAAFVGIIALVYLGWNGIQTIDKNIDKTNALNATSEAAINSQRIQPTATPLISINAVVLPGGHRYSETGNHSFNLDEVPEAYRASYQRELSAPPVSNSVQRAPGSPIVIQINDIGVNSPIIAGDSWAVLQAAVGHHPYSSGPGVPGNMVLTGHDDIFGEVFRRLHELEPGAEIRIQAEGGKWYTYIVERSFHVEPDDTWVMDQGLGKDTPLVTLITCYPYRVNNLRWIIQARLVSSS